MIKTYSDKIQGCIYGLAIGDALGYPIEFYTANKIKYTFGEVDDFEETSINDFKKGIYSDDTQMSISTAEGILNGKDINDRHTILSSILNEYIKWYHSQKEEENFRCPGNTCMSSLKEIIDDELTYDMLIQNPLNDSKGCGGIMRVAPIGLVSKSVEQAYDIGYASAIMTHGHPSGYISSGYMSGLIHCLMEGKSLTESIEIMNKIIDNIPDSKEVRDIVDLAVTLSQNKRTDANNIRDIGGGWVGEETLGIALYCSLKYTDNFKAGVLTSINHGGDSDSTGSVTGAILGVINRVDRIPLKWREEVENSNFLKTLSDRLTLFREGK